MNDYPKVLHHRHTSILLNLTTNRAFLILNPSHIFRSNKKSQNQHQFFSNRSIILLFLKYTSSYGLLFAFLLVFFLSCNDIFWSNSSEWRDNHRILHFCTNNLRISALINKTKYTIVCLREKVNKRGMSVSIKQIKYLLSVEGRHKQLSSVNKCHLCPLQCGTVLYYLPQKLKQKVNQAWPVLFSTVSHSVCLCYITLQWHIDCPS